MVYPTVVKKISPRTPSHSIQNYLSLSPIPTCTTRLETIGLNNKRKTIKFDTSTINIRVIDWLVGRLVDRL